MELSKHDEMRFNKMDILRELRTKDLTEEQQEKGGNHLAFYSASLEIQLLETYNDIAKFIDEVNIKYLTARTEERLDDLREETIFKADIHTGLSELIPEIDPNSVMFPYLSSWYGWFIG